MHEGGTWEPSNRKTWKGDGLARYKKANWVIWNTLYHTSPLIFVYKRSLNQRYSGYGLFIYGGSLVGQRHLGTMRCHVLTWCHRGGLGTSLPQPSTQPITTLNIE